MKYDPMKLFGLVPSANLRHRLMDWTMEWAIPFSRQLGLHIDQLTSQRVEVLLPARSRRKNHVGGAHACALALLAEYPAGLLLAQRYSPAEYRIIISRLNMDYMKQVKDEVVGICCAPTQWPDSSDEIWVELKTSLQDKAGRVVAEGQTRWQVKRWSVIGDQGRSTSNEPNKS